MDFDEDFDYLNLEDILAQAQLVNCKFLINISDFEIQNQEVTQGAEIILPFWMAKVLYTYSMIDIELPKVYTTSFLEILGADAEVVDLHRAGPHYYRFGKLLIGIKREKGNNQANKFRREEGETLEDRKSITSSLLSTFHQRRHKLLEYSINAAANQDIRDVRSFQSRLDEMEKRLFELGQQQVNELDRWNTSKVMNSNQIATRLLKRRKLES